MKLAPIERYIVNCLLVLAVQRELFITGPDGELTASTFDLILLKDRFAEYDWAYLKINEGSTTR